MSVAGACMVCRGPSEVVLTVETPSEAVLAHYAACWPHVDDVVQRCRLDVDRWSGEARRRGPGAQRESRELSP